MFKKRATTPYQYRIWYIINKTECGIYKPWETLKMKPKYLNHQNFGVWEILPLTYGGITIVTFDATILDFRVVLSL